MLFCSAETEKGCYLAVAADIVLFGIQHFNYKTKKAQQNMLQACFCAFYLFSVQKAGIYSLKYRGSFSPLESLDCGLCSEIDPFPLITCLHLESDLFH